MSSQVRQHLLLTLNQQIYLSEIKANITLTSTVVNKVEDVFEILIKTRVNNK